MHVTGGKDEDGDWADYRLSEAAEEQLLKRFRTHGDPLKFLICTSKLGTGFDAPIEGVMYLDKPLKNHTLYQTITRTNRNWRNPVTGQDKRYGIVVDYVGLGGGFARAMAPANPDQATRQIDVDSLIDTFETQLAQTLWGFSGLDRINVTVDTLIEAQARLKDPSHREVFVTHFGMLAGIWEACAPHDRLAKHRDDYRFLAKVYASITPSGGADAVLWERLGAKTIDLVHSKMSDIRVTKALDVIVADADTIQRLQDEGLIAGPHEVTNKTSDQIIDSISERLKAALAKAKAKADGQNPNHPVLVSLGARLEELRKATIPRATDSISWLQEAFTLARDVTQAEKAIDGNGIAGLDLLPDPNVGALTQIFREYAPTDAPEMVEDVVSEIDAIVKQVRYDGWAVHSKGDRTVRQAIRSVLRKYELHRTAGLFDRAYAYIAEHY